MTFRSFVSPAFAWLQSCCFSWTRSRRTAMLCNVAPICGVRLSHLAGLSPLTQYVKCGGFYRWWNTWSAYTGFNLQEDGTPIVIEQETSRPRPLQINNNCLLDLQNSYEKHLKPGLQEGKDFKLVFESTWHLLHGWYGGEPACMRRWVGGAHPWVEVYALQLIIRRSSDQKESQLFIPREVCRCLQTLIS